MWAWLKSIFSSEEKKKKQAEEEEKLKKQAEEEEEERKRKEKEKKQAEEEEKKKKQNEEEEKKKKQAEEEENEKKQAEEESKAILEKIQNRIESKIYSDLKRIYVAVVGQAGVGKSTLINSILSAAQNEFIKSAPTGQGESVTVKTLLYNVMLENAIQLPIHLIDCQGLSWKVTVDSINTVISGDRELLTPIKTQDVSETNDKNVFFDILDPRTASIAFLVFSANWVQNYRADANKEMLDKMFQTKSKLRKSGIPSFVILTKIDAVDESVKDKILDFNSENITKLTTRLGNFMKIDPEDIYPVWNITGRDFNVKQRCHILRLLKHTVLNGLEHARQCKNMEAAKKQGETQRKKETKSKNPNF